MFQHINDDHYDIELSIDDGLDSLLFTSSLRVQYFWSFDYCVTWKLPMYTRQSSTIKKGCKDEFQASSSPNESIHHKWTKKKKKEEALRNTKVDDGGATTDDKSDCDILDIDSTQQKHVNKTDGWFARVDDDGVDMSDGDSSSVSSVMSGPLILDSSSSRKKRTSQNFCSACWNLYKKAKKAKAPLKNKLDNDPNSLTCDQWVLLKKWRPKRAPSTTGQLSAHVRLVKKRLMSHANGTNALTRESKQPVCLRQHVFLQRNLAKLLKVPPKPGKKMNRRKRPRDDSLSPRVVKQQRFHSSDLPRHSDNKNPVVQTDSSGSAQNSSQSISSGFDGGSEQEMDGPDTTDHTRELTSSSVNVEESLKPQEVRVKPKAPKKTAGFRDLLAQMRANTSVIVREPCQ